LLYPPLVDCLIYHEEVSGEEDVSRRRKLATCRQQKIYDLRLSLVCSDCGPKKGVRQLDEDDEISYLGISDNLSEIWWFWVISALV
jgi:hypothetical protein